MTLQSNNNGYPAKAENQKIYLIYSQKKYIIVRAVDYFGFYAI